MTAHGAFHWNELMTWGPDEAKAFYEETLGWTYDAVPMPGGDLYALQGRRGAGRRHLRDEAEAGHRIRRRSGSLARHIAVDDIDSRLARVEAAGGEICRPAFDVPDIGRFAVVKDKAGGIVGWVIPAGER